MQIRRRRLCDVYGEFVVPLYFCLFEFKWPGRLDSNQRRAVPKQLPMR